MRQIIFLACLLICFFLATGFRRADGGRRTTAPGFLFFTAAGFALGRAAVRRTAPPAFGPAAFDFVLLTGFTIFDMKENPEN
jgi:hypothetical protein